MRRRDALTALAPLALAGCIRLENARGTRSYPQRDSVTAETESTTTKGNDTTTSPEGATTNESSTTTDSTVDSTTEDPATSEKTESGPTILEVAIDWDALAGGIVEPSTPQFSGAFEPAPSGEDASTITHVGARLVDGDGSLIATRSVERSRSTNVLQVLADATNDATLNLAAVDATSNSTSTVALASLDTLTIGANATIRIDATTARWLRAEWVVLEEYAGVYENGTFTADADADRFTVGYGATYPFAGQDLRYRELLVTLQNIGGPIENTGDYHTYHVSARNPDPGTPGESTHTFQPDLASDDFALPTGRYPIPPQGEFAVRWE